MHREINKLKLGDQISWSGKNRNERGGGTIVAIGSEEQCKTTKKNIEDSSSTAKSPPSSQSVCSRKYSSITAANNKTSNSIAKPSSKNTSATLISPRTSTSSFSFRPTTTSTKISNASSRSPISKEPPSPISFQPPSTSTKISNASSRSPISKEPPSPISFQPPTTSTKISNASSRPPNTKESTSSNDSASEPGYIIDEDVRDENDDFVETTTKEIPVSEKDISLTSTNNECVDEDDEQEIPMAAQAKKCRASDVKTKTVSSSKYNTLVQQNKALAKQIERYKSTWMPRPTDPKTIKFFVEFGRLLAGEIDNDQPNGEGDKGDSFDRCCMILEMDADEVEECTKADSITKTCRSIVGKLVPKHERAGKTWQSVSPKKRQAVLSLARMFHPSELKTDGELTKACRNVFEVAKAKKYEEQVE